MERFTQKQLKAIGNAERFYERVSAWQAEHNNTTGLPSALALNCECIGYSIGTYGCNGSLFRDIDSMELFGIGNRDYTVYIR